MASAPLEMERFVVWNPKETHLPAFRSFHHIITRSSSNTEVVFDKYWREGTSKTSTALQTLLAELISWSHLQLKHRAKFHNHTVLLKKGNRNHTVCAGQGCAPFRIQTSFWITNRISMHCKEAKFKSLNFNVIHIHCDSKLDKLLTWKGLV